MKKILEIKKEKMKKMKQINSVSVENIVKNISNDNAPGIRLEVKIKQF